MLKLEEKGALVHFLKHNAGLVPRRPLATQKPVHSVDEALAVLLSNKYQKARKQRPSLPPLTDRSEALEALALLQWANLLRKVELPVATTPSGPWYRKHVRRCEEKSAGWNPLQEGDYFVWVDSEPPPSSRRMELILPLVVPVTLVLLFRDSLATLPWKIYIQHRDDYNNLRHSLTTSTLFNFVLLLLIAPVLLVIIRAAVFVATHVNCGRGFWLFPNLLVDGTFLGPFSPLYAWDDTPKESLGLKWRRFKNSILTDLGMSRRRRGRRKSRQIKHHGK